jgi:hypothetical protein
MSELEVFRSTLICAAGGIALGAILGFLNGWARARYAGHHKPPVWLDSVANEA